MHGAHKATTRFHKRQQRMVLAFAQQHAAQRQCEQLIERLQQEQRDMSLHKRRRCDGAHNCGGQEEEEGHEEQEATKKTTNADNSSLDELKASVQRVQCQVARAARHIQELRALVHGLVEQRRRCVHDTVPNRHTI